jgi:hypothetical protein
MVRVFFYRVATDSCSTLPDSIRIGIDIFKTNNAFMAKCNYKAEESDKERHWQQFMKQEVYVDARHLDFWWGIYDFTPPQIGKISFFMKRKLIVLYLSELFVCVVVGIEESEQESEPEYTWKEITREFDCKVRPSNY